MFTWWALAKTHGKISPNLPLSLLREFLDRSAYFRGSLYTPVGRGLYSDGHLRLIVAYNRKSYISLKKNNKIYVKIVKRYKSAKKLFKYQTFRPSPFISGRQRYYYH